jgi:hypothetical protein
VATPLESPLTSTGVSRSDIVPSPTWPKSLRPQHFAAPATLTAQVWPPCASLPPAPT